MLTMPFIVSPTTSGWNPSAKIPAVSSAPVHLIHAGNLPSLANRNHPITDCANNPSLTPPKMISDKQAMTIGSLFAGIGGFDLAFERQGFRTLWNCEIDQNCQKLLAKRFPKAIQHGDIATFQLADFECPDVITFGSPCQDLSVAGRRQGMAGERSGLFYEAIRVIRGFVGRGLRFALWENVPGVFSSNGGRDFAAVLGALAQCGALDIGWRVLDAQFWGVPQRRKRVFLVADFGGKRAAEILSLAESLCGDPPPRREAREGIAPTVEGRAGSSGGYDFETSGGLAEVAKSIRAMTGGIDREDMHTLIPCGRQDFDNDIYVAFSSKDSGNDAGEIAPTLRSQNFKDSHMNGGGQVAVAAFKPNQGAKSRSIGYSEDVAPTCEAAQGGNNKPALLMGSTVRRLTPTECLRLMGLPDDWLDGFEFSDSVKYRLIGNSVAIPVVEWLAGRIRQAL